MSFANQANRNQSVAVSTHTYLDQSASVQKIKDQSSMTQVVQVALEALIHSASNAADMERFTAKYPNISFYTYTDGTQETAVKVILLWAITFCTAGLVAIFLFLIDLAVGEDRTVRSDRKKVMCQLIDEMASSIYRAQFEINDVREHMYREKMVLGLLTGEQPSTSMKHLKYEQMPLEVVFKMMRADINALKFHVEALARKAKVKSKNRVSILNEDDIKGLEQRAQCDLKDSFSQHYTEVACLAEELDNINKICRDITRSVLKKQ